MRDISVKRVNSYQRKNGFVKTDPEDRICDDREIIHAVMPQIRRRYYSMAETERVRFTPYEGGFPNRESLSYKQIDFEVDEVEIIIKVKYREI